MMDDDIWESGEPDRLVIVPAVTPSGPLLGYLIAAVIAGVFIVAAGYFTVNMVAMIALSQALGQ